MLTIQDAAVAAAGDSARLQATAQQTRMSQEIAQLTSQVEGLLLGKVELERYGCVW